MSQESDFSEDQAYNWIQWFCSIEDHDFFAEVDQNFFKDPFNLNGLPPFPNFNEALNMILREESPQNQDLKNSEFIKVYEEASDIYGLVHARFILTSKGLNIMREKFLLGKFGTCPKVYCQKQNVIPLGLSDTIKTSRVKVFCPRCQEVYFPKKKCPDIDGAYFGTSFPHILLKAFPDIAPKTGSSTYVPKIFGFRLHRELQPQKQIKEVKQEKRKGGRR